MAELCRRLDVAGIIDRACPVREVALVTHGQVIEALVANRLTSPMPLVQVQDWAGQWALEEVWGIESATLNDDRLGRALDAIARSWSRSWVGRCPRDRRLRAGGGPAALGPDLDLAGWRRPRPLRGSRPRLWPSHGPPADLKQSRPAWR
jgi:Domain of unknown function (DUF4277)